MQLETERLILRKYKETDFEDLFAYLSDAQVVAFEPYKPMSEDEVRDNLAWHMSTEEMLAIEEKATGRMIGNVYLGNRDFESKELGYVLNRNYWGKGFAAEACAAVIQAALSTGTHRIYADVTL